MVSHGQREAHFPTQSQNVFRDYSRTESQQYKEDSRMPIWELGACRYNS